MFTNAQHAMKEKGGGGLLRIVTRYDGGFCRAEVTDDGPGIPPETLKRIFDPFFSTKRVGQGTGLGLSIAYGTVRDHGGRIHARSRPGHGTTFVVEIPANAAAVELQPAASDEDGRREAAGPGKRIL